MAKCQNVYAWPPSACGLGDVCLAGFRFLVGFGVLGRGGGGEPGEGKT